MAGEGSHDLGSRQVSEARPESREVFRSTSQESGEKAAPGGARAVVDRDGDRGRGVGRLVLAPMSWRRAGTEAATCPGPHPPPGGLAALHDEKAAYVERHRGIHLV